MKRVNKLIILYIGGIVLFSLIQFWISNGYPGILKENYNGGSQRFQTIKCQSDLLPNCSKVDFSQKDQKILLGDSEAMSLSDEFKKRFGSKGFVFAKNGCSFITDEIYRESFDSTCKEKNFSLFTELKKQCRADIYVFNRFVPKDLKEQEIYLDFLNQVGVACNKLVVVGTPLQIRGNFSAYSSLLFKKSFDSPKFFEESDFMVDYINWNKEFRKQVKSFESIFYLDTEALLAKEFPTTLKNDTGDYLYTDSTHVSRYGAEIIVGNLP
jgi:hypothetical protein